MPGLDLGQAQQKQQGRVLGMELDLRMFGVDPEGCIQDAVSS